MIYHDLVYWIALKAVPGVGCNLFKTLIDALETPQKVFNSSFRRLQSIPGIGEATARQILAFDQWDKAENEFKRLGTTKSYLVTYKDPLYPQNLLQIYDFPPFLYVKGSLQTDDIPVALVGSRLASPYGRFTTEKLSRELALNGITVVSGLARGIDSAAHRGAMSARGRTIAVLGCGIDVVYPPENYRLYESIPEHGAIISEYQFGTPPHRLNFPARNRIISGISYGVVVVEAGEKSGSLITARLALEQGREVFAVPGSIDASGSRGTHKLIREGARLVQSVRDIIDEISPQFPTHFRPELPKTIKTDNGSTADSHQPSPVSPIMVPAQSEIMKILSAGPIHIDELAASTGMAVAALQPGLLTLELQGLILKLPGNNYKVKD